MNIGTPDMPELAEYAAVYGENQTEYEPLPAIKLPNGDVITRWSPSDHERARIARGEDIYVQVKTFRAALQPQLLTVGPPVVAVPEKPGGITITATVSLAHAVAASVPGEAPAVLTCGTCDTMIADDVKNDMPDIVMAVTEHAQLHSIEEPRVFSVEAHSDPSLINPDTLEIRVASRAQVEAYTGGTVA